MIKSPCKGCEQEFLDKEECLKTCPLISEIQKFLASKFFDTVTITGIDSFDELLPLSLKIESWE